MQTNNIKKVLIALDYDPTAKKVAEVGFEMAKAMGAEITLIHVIVDLVTYSLTYLNMGPLQSDSGMELKDASHQFLEKTKQYLGDMTIQTLIKEGDFSDSILETAKEINADCIVIGSHSQKWLENIVMGSVTKEVLRKTTIPLFIVPTRKRDDK
jgi:nucleotide-binding universal stress UspA family protein